MGSVHTVLTLRGISLIMENAYTVTRVKAITLLMMMSVFTVELKGVQTVLTGCARNVMKD